VNEQQVEAARASLAYATAQVGYARITAPISGVVASVATEEGETVAASFAAPTFLTLLDPSRLEVWAYVDETDIGRIRNGQTARFTVDTYGDEEFDGRVTAVHPKAEIRDNVVDYVTVVQFQRPKNRTLRPEMTTTVRVALATRTNVLSVPIRAVHWQGTRAYVLVPSARDKAAAPEPALGDAGAQGRELLGNSQWAERGRRGPRRRRHHETGKRREIVIELVEIGKRYARPAGRRAH
jgi:RND family efflux transporter MFP subunit